MISEYSRSSNQGQAQARRESLDSPQQFLERLRRIEQQLCEVVDLLECTYALDRRASSALASLINTLRSKLSTIEARFEEAFDMNDIIASMPEVDLERAHELGILPHRYLEVDWEHW